MSNANIFLVGPGSVGKTTTGRFLAKGLGRRFVDIDFRFCEQIALIPDYIESFGYQAYCEANSRLVDQLVEEYPSDAVFATPSGFLAHESSPRLVKKHLKLVGNGISVLLLPSTTPEAGAELIVQRQLARYPEMQAEVERQRFISRFEKYKDKGDIRIIATDKPELVAKQIAEELVHFKVKQPEGM